MSPEATDLRVPPRRFSALRIAVFRGLETVARLLGGRRFYRSVYLGRRAVLRREVLEVEGLPAGLDGLRIAQFSDLHAGPFLGRGDLAGVVGRVAALEPDLVVLTGDLITRRWEEALEVLPDLARLQPRYGSFGVFGNHDYRGREEGRIAEAYAGAGIELLRDESRRVDTGDGVLAIVGLEDLEEARSVDVARARRGVQPGDTELVLCHNPLGGPRLARAGCVAVLSGHTHGHQIDLPVVRGLGPPHPGNRVGVGETALIVSRGLGVVGLPLRVHAPAEVVVVELTRAPAPRPALGHAG